MNLLSETWEDLKDGIQDLFRLCSRNSKLLSWLSMVGALAAVVAGPRILAAALLTIAAALDIMNACMKRKRLERLSAVIRALRKTDRMTIKGPSSTTIRKEDVGKAVAILCEMEDIARSQEWDA